MPNDTAVMEVRVKTAKARSDLDKLKTKGNLVQRTIAKIGSSRGVSKIVDDARRAKGQVNGLITNVNRLYSVMTAGVVLLAVRGIGRLIDGYKDVNALLNIVSDSQSQFNRTQKELFVVAQSNYASIKGTTKLYAGQAKQLKALGFAHSQQISVVDLFSKALATSGSSTAESSSATLQWVQALGSGVLRGQEFNSIMENGRGVAIALADGLKVGIGELRNMALEGNLTAKVVVDALLSQEEAIKSKFAKIPITISKAWTQMRNSATVALSKVNDNIGDATGKIANLISSLSKSFDKMNLEAVGISLAVISGVLLTSLIPAVVKTGIATTVAFATNPILLMGSAIVVLASALAIFNDDTVTIGDNTATVGDFVIETWSFVKAKLLIFYDEIKNSFNELSGTVEKDTSPLTWGETFASIADVIADVAVTAIQYFGQIRARGSHDSVYLSAQWQKFRLTMESVSQGAKDAFNVLWAYLKLRGAEALGFLVNQFATKLGSIGKAVSFLNKSAGESLISTARALTSSVDSNIQTLKTQATLSDFIKKNNKGWIESEMGKQDTIIATAGDKLDNFVKKSDSIIKKAWNTSAVDSYSDAIEKIGKKAETRQFMREFKNDIESMGGNMSDASVYTEKLTSKVGGLKKETDKLTKSQKDLKTSTDKLVDGRAKTLIDLEKERLKMGKNEVQLYKLNLEQLTYGKNKLKLTVKEVAHRVQLKLSNIAYRDSLKNIAANSKAIKDAVKWATSLTTTKEKLIAKLKGGAIAVFKLTKEYLLLNPAQKKSAELDFLKVRSLQKAIEKQDLYREDMSKLKDQIGFVSIAINEGERAERLAILTNKYGNEERANQVLIQGEILEAYKKEKTMLGEMKSAITDFLDGTNRKWADLRDALLKPIKMNISASFSGISDTISRGINGFMKGEGGGGFKGIGGQIAGMFGSGGLMGGLAKAGGGIMSMFSGGGMMSGLSTAFSGISMAMPAIGALVALTPLLKKGFKSLFNIKTRATIGSSEYAYGKGEAKDMWDAGNGFYRNKHVRGQENPFNKESELGRFGLISKRTKRVGGEESRAWQAVLGAMKETDDVLASLMSDSSKKRVRKELVTYSDRGNDPLETADNRLDFIIANSDAYIRELVDVGGTFEEQTKRIVEISVISEKAVPHLKTLGLQLGRTDNAILKNSVRFADLAGGMDNLLNASNHYYDVVMSNAEKQDYALNQSSKAIDEYNESLGLEGNARIESLNGLKMYTQGLDLTTESGRESALASYAVADAFALVTEMDKARVEIVGSYHDAGLSANVGLEALRGGIEGLLPAVDNYRSKFDELDQGLIKQGQFAQDIIAVADQLGIDPSQLDSFRELRVQVEKFKGNPEAIEALLGLADASDFIGKTGLSAVDALNAVDKSLLDIVGGVQTLEVATPSVVAELSKVEDSFLSLKDSSIGLEASTKIGVVGVKKLADTVGHLSEIANDTAVRVNESVESQRQSNAILGQLVSENRELRSVVTKFQHDKNVSDEQKIRSQDEANYLAEKGQRKTGT